MKCTNLDGNDLKCVFIKVLDGYIGTLKCRIINKEINLSSNCLCEELRNTKLKEQIQNVIKRM